MNTQFELQFKLKFNLGCKRDFNRRSQLTTSSIKNIGLWYNMWYRLFFFCNGK